MKKLSILLIAGMVLIAGLLSCHWHNTSIRISDSEDEYKMTAHYEARKTHRVMEYLKESLQDADEDINFRHGVVNDDIRLEDNTEFHLFACPGELKIKIDKTENSGSSCERIKAVCEDIKSLLAAE